MRLGYLERSSIHLHFSANAKHSFKKMEKYFLNAVALNGVQTVANGSFHRLRSKAKTGEFADKVFDRYFYLLEMRYRCSLQTLSLIFT